MRVFVTGATGVIGRRVLPRLVAAGHEVTAVARTPVKAEGVRSAGAHPVTLDLFDPEAARRALDGHDAVINLATRIPPPTQAATPSAWREGTRLRTEGSRVLADAAIAVGVPRFVQESIAFIYSDRGSEWIDEDVPLDPPPLAAGNVAAEASARRFGDAGGIGVVLRFGQFYAWESAHTRAMCRQARLRLPAMPGPRDAYCPAVAVDDAAAAAVAALDVTGGTWNVCDDRPLTRDEYNAGVAEALGVRPPLLTGTALLRLSSATRFYVRSQRISNQRFRSATGWSPAFPDARIGWVSMAAAGG